MSTETSFALLFLCKQINFPEIKSERHACLYFVGWRKLEERFGDASTTRKKASEDKEVDGGSKETVSWPLIG